GRERGRRVPDPAATGLVLVGGGRRAVTPLADGTGLVWDLTRFPAAALAGGAGEKELSGWWADLLGDDPAVGYAAVWRLSDAPPAVVVPFLAGKLRPAACPEPATVQGWVRDLDHDNFRVRQAASERLAALGR